MCMIPLTGAQLKQAQEQHVCWSGMKESQEGTKVGSVDAAAEASCNVSEEDCALTRMEGFSKWTSSR